MFRGETITPGQPGYLNLEAACSGVVAPGVNPNALRVPGVQLLRKNLGQIFSLQKYRQFSIQRPANYIAPGQSGFPLFVRGVL